MLNRSTFSVNRVLPGGVFSEGERVFVRVLGFEGGKYTVSCGGVRFFAESERTLNEGDSFPALIKYQNGKIHLLPQYDSVPSDSGAVGSGGGEDALPPTLASFLTALGVPPDAVSLSLVRFMQQFGFKFDAAAAFRARKLAAKFPGREKQAAEAALYALEKGMDADERMVEKILEAHDEGAARGADEGGKGESFLNEEDAHSEESFLFGLFEQKTLLNAKAGFLTLCNHIVSSNLHWVLLPFEQGEHIRGIIRFLLNISKKTLEKAEIRARVMDKTCYFVIYYEHVIPIEIRVNGGEEYAHFLSQEFSARGVTALVSHGREPVQSSLFVDEKELLTICAEA
jgi:hypothetical protein